MALIEGAVSVEELVEELELKVEFQTTLREFDEDDFLAIIKRATRRLYIDTGRAQSFKGVLKYERGQWYIDDDLDIDEIEYILICAQIDFFNIVKAGVNEMISYTTDALSVTNADKPYANIDGTVSQLENERRRVFYSMRRYTIGDPIE